MNTNGQLSALESDPVKPEDAELMQVLDTWMAARESGQLPDLESVVAAHPAIADRLRACLASLQLIEHNANSLRPLTSLSAPRSDPEQLGDFRILRPIAQGGMGIVYEAEQISLRRRVALKVLPFAATLDSQHLQRFRNEAQAAACLQHANIVPVFSVGCESGVHYYAMQLIEGQTLSDFIFQLRGQEKRAPTSSLERTTLYQPPPRDGEPTPLPRADVTPRVGEEHRGPDFYRKMARLGIQAAQALDHAHQLGIVHRDIKPANLLLDGTGHLWVTDFGLAHIQQSDVQLTLTGQALGTPRYMSPEQASASRGLVDHRTDIYSLGATLYELLTLRPAFAVEDRQELLRQIALDEPVRPRRLEPTIPAELEIIVLKAMEKRPQDRYATAQELAEDLERFLQDQPIRARRPTLRTRLGKWSRRNRTLVNSLSLSAAVVLVVSLLAALGYARQQQQLAEARAAQTQQANESAEQMRVLAQAAQKNLDQVSREAHLLAGIFHDLDPSTETLGGPSLRLQLKERVAEVVQQLNEEAISDPLTLATLQEILGNTLRELSEFDRAIELLSKGRATRESIQGRTHLETLRCMNSLARAYLESGQLSRALPLFEQVLALRKEKLGPEHPDTLTSINNLARTYMELGQRTRGLPLLEQVLALRKEKQGPDHPGTLSGMNNLALAYQQVGQLDKAVSLYEQALAKRREKLGPDHSGTLRVMHNLALAYQAKGQWAQALPLLEQSLTMRKRKLGPDHIETLASMNCLAGAYSAAGQTDRALPLQEQVLAKQKERLGADHPVTLKTMNSLARTYRVSGQLAKALSLNEQTLAKQKEKLGPEHPDTLATMSSLGMACLEARKLARAVSLLEQALAKQKEKLGSEHPDTLMTMSSLGAAYHAIGQMEKALPLLKQTLIKQKEKLGDDHPATLRTMNNLGAACHAARQLDSALSLLNQALTKQKKMLGADHGDTLSTLNNLAVAYHQAGQVDKAIPMYEQALAKLKGKLGPDHPKTLTIMNSLASAYGQIGKPERSRALLEGVLPGFRKLYGPNHPETLYAQAFLALWYKNSGHLDKAIPLLEDAQDRAEKRTGGIPTRLAGIRPELAATYELAGQLAKAEKVRRAFLAFIRQRGEESPERASALAELGFNLLQQKKYGEAETFLRQSLSLREKKWPGRWTTHNTASLLGGALLGQKKYAEAEPLLKKGYEGMKAHQEKIPPQGRVRLLQALERLVQLYEATADAEEAARWRKALERVRSAMQPPLSAPNPSRSKQDKPKAAMR